MNFENFLGIDYSGAKTANSPLPGIRVFHATPDLPASEIRRSPDLPRRNWSRESLNNWLFDFLIDRPSTLIGIDHGLSFPLAYHQARNLCDWNEFLIHFKSRWPNLKSGSVDESLAKSKLSADYEKSSLLRLCEKWTPGPTSVFRTVGQGSVGKSTFAGLAQISTLIDRYGRQLQIWPFDGWKVKSTHPVLAEVYPSLWRRRFTHKADGTTDQRDAKAVACWLRHQQATGQLTRWFSPVLDTAEKAQAEREGWILGVA